jgi:hypothetical protein
VNKKTEKPNHEKKPIKILKKPASSIRFGFDKPKTKKNQAKSKKPSQIKKTKSNWFEPVFVLKTKPKPVGLNRFRFGFYLFFLKF